MTTIFSKSTSLFACTALIGAGLVLSACSESDDQTAEAPEAASEMSMPEVVTDAADDMVDVVEDAADEMMDETEAMITDASDMTADSTGVIKQRQEIMKSYGAATKDLADMMMGKTEMNVDTLKAHADQLASTSGDPLVALFPEGSLDEKTEALPTIWESWDEFAAISTALNTQAIALQAALNEDDPKAAIVVPFTAIGKACQDCHTKFRKEQKWGQ